MFRVCPSALTLFSLASSGDLGRYLDPRIPTFRHFYPHPGAEVKKVSCLKVSVLQTEQNLVQKVRATRFNKMSYRLKV